MSWIDKITGRESLNEAIKSFIGKGESILTDKQVEKRSGEGIENLSAMGFGATGLESFNMFYNRYINKEYESEYNKIIEYRKIAEYPEISDVIEDAVNESTEENIDGQTFTLNILDDEISKNKNIVDTLFSEFNDFFYNRLNINEKINNLFRTYMIDGRLYYERVINTSNQKNGIINIKRLPSETMDFTYNTRTGRTTSYYQYLKKDAKRPLTAAEANESKDIIVFNPEQIGFIDHGMFGKTRHDIYGYLEKAKVPYNQLKLLETSVIIYRIVRAPERLVFKIDTGNMPKDKAMRFVDKVKNKFIKKQTYNPTTGNLTHEPEILSILENFFIPTSADGRGSDITTVGGNAAGFTELDDIYYFARKLYRALKYPLSRISANQEKREADNIIGGSKAGEISRDEVKWSKFLVRHQNNFCKEFKDLFLLHLEFKGLKNEYKLDKNSIRLSMNAPSHYKDSMEQGFLEQQFNNYNSLSNNEEFSKYFLAKKYLHYTDEDVEDNKEGFIKDEEFFTKKDDENEE